MTKGSYKCLLLTIVAILLEPPCHINGMDKMGALQGIVERHVSSVFTKEFEIGNREGFAVSSIFSKISFPSYWAHSERQLPA
jgi:hypothetical protein